MTLFVLLYSIVKLPPLKFPNDVMTVSGRISVEYWTTTEQDILMLTLDVIGIVRVVDRI
jgi:hypothetical protein